MKYLVIGLAAILLIAAVILVANLGPSKQTTATIVDGPAYIASKRAGYSATTKAWPENSVAAPADSDAIVAIDAENLLAAYKTDAPAADERFKHAYILLTGPLTQVFIPSVEEQMKMAEKDLEADAVLMIDSVPVPSSSPGQALFTPGIAAHSKNGSFFGVSPIDARPLTPGRAVSLLCKGAEYSRISEMTGQPPSMFGDIAISLDGCVFHDPPAQRAAAVPTAN